MSEFTCRVDDMLDVKWEVSTRPRPLIVLRRKKSTLRRGEWRNGRLEGWVVGEARGYPRVLKSILALAFRSRVMGHGYCALMSIGPGIARKRVEAAPDGVTMQEGVGGE